MFYGLPMRCTLGWNDFLPDNFSNKIVLGCQYDKGCAKISVWTRGEYSDLLVTFGIDHFVCDIDASFVANPVALHIFQRIAPVNTIKVFLQAVGVFSNLEKPLL